MKTITRGLHEPDGKSALAGMAFGILLAALAESPLFASLAGAEPAWWMYVGTSAIWLGFAYLSYRDDATEVQQTA